MNGARIRPCLVPCDALIFQHKDPAYKTWAFTLVYRPFMTFHILLILIQRTVCTKFRLSPPGINYVHSKRGCLFHCDSSSPGAHILNWNGDMPHWECTSPPGMGMCLTGNAHPHREFISSSGTHIVYAR